MRCGVSLVAQPEPAQGSSSFSYSTPAQTANPGRRHLRPRMSLGHQHFRTKVPKGRLSLTWPRAAPGAPRNRPPLLFPHGFLGLRPTSLRSSSRTPAKRPGRRQRARPCTRLPVSAPVTSAFVWTQTPHHAPTLSSPPPPAARNQGSFPSSRCFVSDVKSRPQKLPGRGPAPTASPVSSFPALLSLEASPPGEERGPRTKRKGVGFPVVRSDGGGKPCVPACLRNLGEPCPRWRVSLRLSGMRNCSWAAGPEFLHKVGPACASPGYKWWHLKSNVSSFLCSTYL